MITCEENRSKQFDQTEEHKSPADEMKEVERGREREKICIIIIIFKGC